MKSIEKRENFSDIPLESIDVSDPLLYKLDTWRPYFQRLREEAPIHYLADSAFGPFWSVTRFEDIIAVENNIEVFSSEPSITIGHWGDDVPLETFVAMDPPRHDKLRAAVQPSVAPRNLAQMEETIRNRVVGILDGLPVGETFDWVERVSIDLTTQMLAILLNFPFEERAKLAYWSNIATAAPEFAGGDADPAERLEAMTDCLATFTRIWHERKSLGDQGGFDLISLLQRDPYTADIVDRPMEYLGNLILLIVGGNDTTRNSISGGVLALNQNPDEYDKLRNNHALIPSMVSEIIRWQTPLMHMRRTATRDFELGGQQIKKGDKVVLWYISANRDESAIERADEFIVDRLNPRRHTSFGFGIHRCMGSRLGEMQLRILWEEIMKRFSFIELMGEPERLQSNVVRGIDSLPVKLHAL